MAGCSGGTLSLRSLCAGQAMSAGPSLADEFYRIVRWESYYRCNVAYDDPTSDLASLCAEAMDRVTSCSSAAVFTVGFSIDQA